MSEILPGIAPLAARYRTVLLDLWGVLHDGTALYPGAHECLIRMKASGMRVLLLSNAPRRAARAQAVLEALGVERTLYDGLLTSGEAGYALLEQGLEGFPPRGTYYYIGPDKDADVLSGLPYAPAPLEQADFILNVGFGSEGEGVADWSAPLAAGLARALPMLCLNPDMEVVKITGERYACAGVIADEYARMGGAVTYIGKPYPQVYARALAMLGHPDTARVLAIGDGLHTDILGATRAGIASVFITGGIVQHALKGSSQSVVEYCAQQGVQPDYVLEGLRW